jgi:hypothetical protein
VKLTADKLYGKEYLSEIRGELLALFLDHYSFDLLKDTDRLS